MSRGRLVWVGSGLIECNLRKLQLSIVDWRYTDDGSRAKSSIGRMRQRSRMTMRRVMNVFEAAHG